MVVRGTEPGAPISSTRTGCRARHSRGPQASFLGLGPRLHVDGSSKLDSRGSALSRLRASSTVALLAASGCLHVYQPMSGLHRPEVVDPQARNLDDVHLTLVCSPGALLTRLDASLLCSRLETLFENQGAVVTTSTGAARDAPPAAQSAPEEAPRTDLTLEVSARLVHASSHPLSWVLDIGSFTLIPGMTESTFEQDITIRDGTGFLLATDSLQGRLVTYFGSAMWLGNKLLDLVARRKEDELTGDVAARDLSNDLYRQLSQTVFNAKMQWEVLQLRAAPAAPVATR